MKVRLMFAALAAAVTVFLSFDAAAATYRVTDGVGTEGDGQSWASPMSITNAVASAMAAGDIILCKAGTYAVSAPLTIATPIAIKGGYEGTDDTTLAADPVSVFDGTDAAAATRIFNITTATADTDWNSFERIELRRAYQNGLVKTGKASIQFEQCRFFANGTAKSQTLNGRGVQLTGSASSEAKFVDCTFDGNALYNQIVGGVNEKVAGAGFGAYLVTWKRVSFDNCLFATNGVTYNAPHNSSWTGQDGFTAAALYAKDAPVTLNGCKFIGNRSAERNYYSSIIGGMIYLTGAGGGSAFTNCLFAANLLGPAISTTSQWGINGGLVILDLSAVAAQVEFDTCTFAYNGSCSAASQCGIKATKGTAKIRNSIFHGAEVCSLYTGAKYLEVRANGRADIDYTLFPDLTDDSIFSASPSYITWGENVYTGDPLFVSTGDDFAAFVKRDGNYLYFDGYQLTNWFALDLHLKSQGGYVNNAGDALTAPGVYSPGIDAGDSATAFANEPDPNGGRVNLGFYGNTAEASKTGADASTIASVVDSYPRNGYSIPRLTVTLGGVENALYNAFVVIEMGTNAASEVGTAYEHSSAEIGGLHLGGTGAYDCPKICLPGDTVYYRVTVKVPGNADAVTTGSFTAGGVIPPWLGKGGGASIVHVWSDGMGTPDGSDWNNAYITVAEAFAAWDNAKHAEIWIAGTNFVAGTLAFAPTVPAAIRGGFTAIENAAGERPATGVAMLDAANSCQLLTINNVADVPVTLDRVCLIRSVKQGLIKTGAGDLTLAGCRFEENATIAQTDAISGRGAHLTGSAATALTVTNCVFSRNVQSISCYNAGSGLGLYVSTFKSTAVMDTVFQENGCLYTAPGGMSSPGRDSMNGAAVYVTGAPSHFERCKFLLNRCTTRNSNGGVVKLVGASGSSSFTNCLFVGNENTFGWDSSFFDLQSTAHAGTLVLDLSTEAAAVDVVNCTFAYNLAASKYGPAAISAVKGAVKVRNSIFWNNVRSTGSLVGKDIYLSATGFADIDYALFEGTGVDFVSAAIEENLTFPKDNILTADPLFAATPELSSVVNTGILPYFKDNQATIDAMYAADTHLKSRDSYRLNDGTLVTDGTAMSPGIDTGDPSAAFAKEPDPNGLRVNLGAYGNTPDASTTPLGQPVIDSVAVTFPDGYTRPRIEVAIGGETGEEVFAATVTVTCKTGGVVVATGTFMAVNNGDTVVFNPGVYLDNGDGLTVEVNVSAPGAVAQADNRIESVTGVKPPWFYAKGPANVIHVREGADDGANDGTSWLDAYGSLAYAVTKLTAEKNEIWFSGDLEMAGVFSIPSSTEVIIRGGFDGSESTASARIAGRLSTIDGKLTFDCITLANTLPVTLDSVMITRGKTHGLYKTGSGDLTLAGCRFVANAVDSDNAVLYGRGAYVAGSSSAKIAVTNCQFLGNGSFVDTHYNVGWGSGLYLTGCARATIDDSLFMTNGVFLAAGGSANPGGDTCRGHAICATSTPLTVRNCKFLSNHGTCRDNNNNECGGAVRIDGASGGSALTNCLFAGNSDRCGWADTAGFHGGALLVKLADQAHAVDVVNCTFAYNLVDGTTSPAGINVYAGTVNVKNAIFFGNMVGNRVVTGQAKRYNADIDVKDGATCNISYTMFGTNGVTSVDAAAGGTVNFNDGNLYGDPLLVTTNAQVQAYVSSRSSTYIYFNTATAWEFLPTINSHLRGKIGYRDETTGEVVKFPKVMSPAIDAGDPAMSAKNEAKPSGGRVNLGVYGNTPYATMSPAKGIVLMFR